MHKNQKGVDSQYLSILCYVLILSSIFTIGFYSPTFLGPYQVTILQEYPLGNPEGFSPEQTTSYSVPSTTSFGHNP